MLTNPSFKKYGMLIILLGVVLVLALSGCGSGSGGEATIEGAASSNQSLDRILSEGTIKIAIPQDTQLFGSQAADGSYEGYDVDVAKLIAEELGVELELVPVSSQNRIPYLTSGRADLVVANMGVQPARAEVIAFSNAYAPFFWAVFGPESIEVDSVADTAPYKVGATLGTMEELALTAAAEEIGTEIVRFPDQATTAQAFISGQVDLIVTGNSIAAVLMRDNPEMAIESKFVIQQSPCHMGALRGETAIIDWVNAFIYAKKLDGTLDELSMKWFGEPLPAFPEF
jgi:polar amino acid transport system substrate-binding protein